MPLYGFASVRSNHQMCSVKKGVLRNFTKFTGKHLCQSVFFNKVAGLRLNFAKFLRTPFLQNTSGRLLLFCQVTRFTDPNFSVVEMFHGCPILRWSQFATKIRQ